MREKDGNQKKKNTHFLLEKKDLCKRKLYAKILIIDPWQGERV